MRRFNFCSETLEYSNQCCTPVAQCALGGGKEGRKIGRKKEERFCLGWGWSEIRRRIELRGIHHDDGNLGVHHLVGILFRCLLRACVVLCDFVQAARQP